jgi:hypothetical protein
MLNEICVLGIAVLLFVTAWVAIVPDLMAASFVKGIVFCRSDLTIIVPAAPRTLRTVKRS